LQKNFGTQLSNFHRIDLSKNYLKFLPDDFGNLTNLKHLDLFNNQLENLPLSFGKLTKLKYLDLKGNPLTPALQKIVGHCLTVKECQDAAKNVVPYYADLAKKFDIEQRKKAEKEQKEKELAALKEREDRRLAKKAARKERVMLERQQKAESEKLLAENDKVVKRDNDDDDEDDDYPMKVVLRSNVTMYLRIFKNLLLISVLFVLLLVLFVKHIPAETKQFIPEQYRAYLDNFANGVARYFKKNAN
jgi:Leucine rich repeat